MDIENFKELNHFCEELNETTLGLDTQIIPNQTLFALSTNNFPSLEKLI